MSVYLTWISILMMYCRQDAQCQHNDKIYTSHFHNEKRHFCFTWVPFFISMVTVSWESFMRNLTSFMMIEIWNCTSFTWNCKNAMFNYFSVRKRITREKILAFFAAAALEIVWGATEAECRASDWGRNKCAAAQEFSLRKTHALMCLFFQLSVSLRIFIFQESFPLGIFSFVQVIDFLAIQSNLPFSESSLLIDV